MNEVNCSICINRRLWRKSQKPPPIFWGQGEVLPARPGGRRLQRPEPGGDLAAQHAPLCALPPAGDVGHARDVPIFHASGRPRLTPGVDLR